MSPVALDSNILVYLAGVSRAPDDDAKIERCREIVELVGRRATLVAPVQALGELFIVVRRAGGSNAEAREIVSRFARALTPAATDERTIQSACDLATDHRFQFWDALIVSAAVHAGCALLLSQDMQDGFVTRGLTIANPLATSPQPALATLLSP